MIGLKGVSKSVIEIQNPDSAYFERAVFFLKPNLSAVPSRIINAEAERWMERIGPKADRRLRKRVVCWLLRTGVGVALGIGMTVLWLHYHGTI